MKYIKSEFTNELATLLRRYGKVFDSDKSGLYIVDNKNISDVLIGRATTASEDGRDKLFFVLKTNTSNE